MKQFQELLDESVDLHGHLCPGQVLGVRMATAGCSSVGIEEPKTTKDLIVYVEIDRCATDAIQSVTGCKLGKRTLKFLDYGKMAATFYNIGEDTAVRVLARDDAREQAKGYATPEATDKEAQTQAYMAMPDRDLFEINPVQIKLPLEDLPGHSVSRVLCDECGEGVSDRREVNIEGRKLCRACANGAYYLPTQGAVGPKTNRSIPVVAIVGNSSSGKTRVAAALIETLSNRGYRIGAIKHCPHGQKRGRPNSDSDRLYRSGAVAVVASSPDIRTIVERVDHDGSLDSLVSCIGPRVDLVIAEGFKSSAVPKILVADEVPNAPVVKNVIATVGDHSRAPDINNYSFDDLHELAALVQEQMLGPEPVSLGLVGA